MRPPPPPGGGGHLVIVPRGLGGGGLSPLGGDGQGGVWYGMVCPAVSGRRIASPSRSPLRARGRGSSWHRHAAGWCTQGVGGVGSSVSHPLPIHPPSSGAPVPCAAAPRALRLFSPGAVSRTAHAAGHCVGRRTVAGARHGSQAAGHRVGRPPVVDSTGVPPFLPACGWCPMMGRTLPSLWVVPYAGRNPP